VQASLAITLDHIIISVYGPEGPITSARPTGSPGVNSWRISELEKLARGGTPRFGAPSTS
jgi:hypothetical protein